MRHNRSLYTESARRDAGVALMVDFDDLFNTLVDRLGSDERAAEATVEVLSEIRRRWCDERTGQAPRTVVFGDFTGITAAGRPMAATLYLMGAEPRFVPATAQVNGSEIQLAAETGALLHSRPDIEQFVLVSGARGYVPLLHLVGRYGRRPVLVAFELPDAADTVGPGWYARQSALDFLGERSRRLWFSTAEPRRSERGAPRSDAARPTEAPPAPEVRRPTQPITDAAGLRTLEIIQREFGHYEEVYLTPLLRKLSDAFEVADLDPKGLVSDLENAGAVWLEKRRGFPYDYTVLLVNTDHPDVQRLRAGQATAAAADDALASGDGGSTAVAEYDDDDQYQDDWDRD